MFSVPQKSFFTFFILSFLGLLCGCTDKSSTQSPSTDESMTSSLIDQNPPLSTVGDMNIEEEEMGEDNGGEINGGDEEGGSEQGGNGMNGGETNGGEINGGTEEGGMTVGGGSVMGGNEMEGGLMGGTSLDSSSTPCIDQMNCLFGCPPQDAQCRQRCVSEGRINDRVALTQAQLCINQSECTTPTCIFTSCVSTLTTCEDLFTPLSCNESLQCIESCAQEPECIMECTLTSSPDVQTELTTWGTCLESQQCTMLGCEACPIEQICQPSGPTTCMELLNCISDCGMNQSCVTQCAMQAPESANALMLELIECTQENQCGSDTMCIQNNCNTELLACAFDMGETPPPPPPPMIETCMDLNGCLEECPDGDGVCDQNCVMNTPQDALDLFFALEACSNEYECRQDVMCLSTNCLTELQACLTQGQE